MRFFVHGIFLVSVSLFLGGCKYGTSKGVKDPYKKLLLELDREAQASGSELAQQRLEMALQLREESEQILKQVNAIPFFSRRYYTIESEKNVKDRLQDMGQRVNRGLQICEEGSLGLQEIIFAIGRQNYESGFVDAGASEVLTLHALQYVKRVYEGCATLNYHYMNELSIARYDSYEYAKDLKISLMENFFRAHRNVEGDWSRQCQGFGQS